MNKYLAALSIIGGSAVAGLLGYGLYGYYRDKGVSSWKAGALTGAVGGVMSSIVVLSGIVPSSYLQAPSGTTTYLPEQVGGLRDYSHIALHAAMPAMVRR